jgi:hypothetical protein
MTAGGHQTAATVAFCVFMVMTLWSTPGDGICHFRLYAIRQSILFPVACEMDDHLHSTTVVDGRPADSGFGLKNCY